DLVERAGRAVILHVHALRPERAEGALPLVEQATLEAPDLFRREAIALEGRRVPQRRSHRAGSVAGRPARSVRTRLRARSTTLGPVLIAPLACGPLARAGGTLRDGLSRGAGVGVESHAAPL